jgi:tetratricopeptide (TPR) repeat protein
VCATPDEQYDADDKESAQATQLEAIGLDPDDSAYHDDLGLALYDQERYEEAEAAYREAVRLDPGNATYHNDLGRALYGQGKYEEAEAAQRELELDAESLPIQNRPATSRTYLIATSCLAGSLVSVGLAVTEIAEYVKHNRVGNLAILGMVIGALAGITAVAVNEEKPPGWAGRINTVAAWLAGIGFFSLLFFYGGQHGWWTHEL